ncbi:WhiB family transcriptional regulator [Pseudonocardia sp. Ae717_Ps2]|uniref:WhiB family transcriptional regulator n=1 Tax=Pseudonocardia sp. Ae717_Ps2 TaxID=1885573 RepID=UPI0009F8669D|nr:WhiB family transcriptional regulator [Pseudonocardia sp. Ae717_Ps2]
MKEETHVVERSPVFDDDPGPVVPVPPELSSHPGRHCVGVAPEVFFPVSELGVLQARLVCTGCPVRVLCRDWASATGQDGIWGGTTATERDTTRHAEIRVAAARPAVAA